MILSAISLGFLLLAQPEASIKVDVRLVNASFTVRDPSGKLVTGLSKSDFEVFDDGLSRPIIHFSRAQDLPLRLGLIVDVSGSQEHFVKQHQKDISNFLKAVLTPRDQAFIVCFANRIRLVSAVSGDPAELVQGLERFHSSKEARLMPELGPPEKRLLGTAFYDAIHYSIQEQLAGTEGLKGETYRKALVVFSDGEDNSSANDMMTAIETAQRYDTVIFAMRYTENRHGSLNGRNKYGIKVMERMGRETGGADFDAGERGMKDFFRKIEEDLRSSYQIGYYPSQQQAADETFHKIRIRPSNLDYKVRAKTGYYAR